MPPAALNYDAATLMYDAAAFNYDAADALRFN